MDEPRIADRTPTIVELEPGTYWWCACGRSAAQPFCDGSHAGTSFEPVSLVLDEARRVALCRCKHTERVPYCDGTHAGL